MSKRLIIRVVVIILLLLLWWRLLSVANQQSVTFDEIIHILQGVLYWQSWPLYSVVQNPPLINALIGLPVQFLFHPMVPFNDPSWLTNDWLNISKLFMWQTNANGLQLIFVARLVVMLLTMLLSSLVYRFARQLFRQRMAGLLALFLLSFDPNILAHGFLATTDLGIAFFLTLFVYLAWRFWALEDGQSWRLGGIAAVSLGLTFSAKFTAVILIPALYLLIVYRAITRRQSWRELLKAGLIVTGWILVGAIVLMSLYRFQWSALATDFRIQQAHQLEGHSAFLHGQIKVGGWWYYFPLAFLIKTPIPTLVLLVIAFVRILKRQQWRSWSLFWLLLPAAAVLGAGIVSQVNIGYRYLLPMLPLLFIFAGQVGGQTAFMNRPGQPPGQSWIWRGGTALLVAALGVTSLTIHPDYLAFFNALVGGPANGWQWLIDSNLDWGQDIGALADYEKTHLLRPYQVAWLGTAPLSAYGIERGRAMAVWPQGREDPLFDDFYPEAPAPGQYVISATQLQGVYLKNPAYFAWFQQQTPQDRIGYSLFVYDVPATGPPVGLGLSGIGLPMIEAADYRQALQSNDVTPRWFDARTSFLWPGGNEAVTWTAVGDGHQPTHPLLTRFYSAAESVIAGESHLEGQDWQYHLYAWPDSPITTAASALTTVSDWSWPAESGAGVAGEPLGVTAVFGDTFEFLGYQIDETATDNSLDLISLWRVVQPPAADLKIFVHLLAADGQIIAQHDGLDIRSQGLQSGDEFAQLHTIRLPDSLPPGEYHLQIGLYRTDDLTRLTVPADNGVVDRIWGPALLLKR